MQLESAPPASRYACLNQFQSHIGAIRIFMSQSLSQASRAFQSHIGAIRMLSARQIIVKRVPNFNPTLVQLESTSHCSTMKRVMIFQSHIGAIRISSVAANLHPNFDFNPTLVQLESATTRRNLTQIDHFFRTFPNQKSSSGDSRKTPDL